jgi:hypothetical protein
MEQLASRKSEWAGSHDPPKIQLWNNESNFLLDHWEFEASIARRKFVNSEVKGPKLYHQSDVKNC